MSGTCVGRFGSLSDKVADEASLFGMLLEVIGVVCVSMAGSGARIGCRDHCAVQGWVLRVSNCTPATVQRMYTGCSLFRTKVRWIGLCQFGAGESFVGGRVGAASAVGGSCAKNGGLSEAKISSDCRSGALC